MKRLLIPTALTLLAAGLMAGCGQAAPAPTAAPTKAAPPAATSAPAAPAATIAPTAAPTKAAGFPEKGKNLSIIVPYAAGGGTDLSARVLASQLEPVLGVPIQVVNKAGAGGQVGLTELAQSKPDGYTIGSSVLPAVITTYLDEDRKPAFGRKDLQLVALHVADASAIAVRADSPYKTVKELIDAAKAKPGTIKMGTTGILGTTHLNILQLQQVTGVEFAIVHFDGGNPMKTALMGGHIDAHFGSAGESLPQYKSKEIRFLGLMDKERSKFYPDVPTLEEQGYKLYAAGTRGYIAPAGIPAEALNTLTGAMKKVMETEEHRNKMGELGLTIRYMDPKDYAAYWQDFEDQVKPLMALAKQK
ncbi:MAG: tripartite tricarboxylate transporter substrate binding protein [Pirellulaceae bacterium]